MMTLAECLATLELGEAATAAEIKRAYHRLVLRSHPDQNRDKEAARRRFIAVVHAYRTLMRALRDVAEGREVGKCRACNYFGEVLRGLDGSPRCPRCALNEPSRLLPMPTPIVVKCAGSLACVIIAALCLVPALLGYAGYAFISLLLGLTGLSLLAHTCVSVGYCLSPAHSTRGATRTPGHFKR